MCKAVPIKDFPSYYITDSGLVYSRKTYKNRDGRIRRIKTVQRKTGYINIGLNRDNKQFVIPLHRLVANAFIPNPDNKPQVNHINGVKDDNRVENLEWVTAKENVRHAFDNGLNGYSEYRCQRAKEETAKPVKCIETGEIFDSLTDAARKYNIDLGHISGCVNGNKYRHTAGGYHWQLLNR